MAAEQLANYSPEDVMVILSNDIFGTHVVSGFTEGTFISYERNVPRSELVTGSDLTATRVLRRNKAGVVTLTLNQSSESNDVFSAIADKDEESHNNDYVFSLTVKDLSGRFMLFAPQAFIGNDPSATFSNTLETRDWTITTVSVDRNFGGNSKLNPENQATLAALGVTVEDKWKAN